MKNENIDKVTESINQTAKVFNELDEVWIQLGIDTQSLCNAYYEVKMFVHKQIHDLLYGEQQKSNNWLKFHGYPIRRRRKYE